MNLVDEGIFVRYIKLPRGVRAATVTNNDGTVSVYINELLSDLHGKQAVEHELKHIRDHHLWLKRPVAVDEQIANQNEPAKE